MKFNIETAGFFSFIVMLIILLVFVLILGVLDYKRNANRPLTPFKQRHYQYAKDYDFNDIKNKTIIKGNYVSHKNELFLFFSDNTGVRLKASQQIKMYDINCDRIRQ